MLELELAGAPVGHLERGETQDEEGEEVRVAANVERPHDLVNSVECTGIRLSLSFHGGLVLVFRVRICRLVSKSGGLR